MIVIDANILIYSLIKCDQSVLIQKLRAKDADWRTAALCLHETLNVLATYQRREVLTLAQCRALLGHADRFIKVAQCEVEMDTELDVASQGASIEQATANLKEAVELFLECADPQEIARRQHSEVYATRFEAVHGYLPGFCGAARRGHQTCGCRSRGRKQG